jgi:hypothetical protein
MVAMDRGSAVEMMGLRLTGGVDRPRLERAAGQDAESLFDRNLPPLVDGGFLTLDRERLAATAAAGNASTRCWPPFSADRPGQYPRGYCAGSGSAASRGLMVCDLSMTR